MGNSFDIYKENSFVFFRFFAGEFLAKDIALTIFSLDWFSGKNLVNGWKDF
jgi:hypothetical protein